MRLKTLASLLNGGRMFMLLRLKGMFMSFYRLSFLASIADSVILEKLSHGPVSARSLSEGFGQDTCLLSATEAWLGLGVRLGLFRKSGAGYSLRGFLARRLAASSNDAVRALIREVAGLHHLYIIQTPVKLQQGMSWDPIGPHREYGDLIARSSRALEPFLFEMIDRVFPKSGSVRLLEVGCGHAGYIAYAAERNKELRAVGLELDPHVAEKAKDAVQARGLAGRVEIAVKDVRDYQSRDLFDILTLYNNIYYFPVKERVGLLTYLKTLLKPEGRIVLTTGCRNGSIEFELVNLIHASTSGWGRLPDKGEMLQQLAEAGFDRPSAISLLPGNSYYAFTGYRPVS